MSKNLKEFFYDLFLLITLLVVLLILFFRLIFFIHNEVEEMKKAKLFYNLSVKVITTDSLSNLKKEFGNDNFIENLLKMKEETTLAGGYFLERDDENNLHIYKLKENKEIDRDDFGNLNFILEDGMNIVGSYNLYKFNVLLDKNNQPVFNETAESIKKKEGDLTIVKNIDWIKHQKTE